MVNEENERIVIEYNSETFIKYREYENWVNNYNRIAELYDEQSQELKNLRQMNNKDASLKLFVLVICLPLFGLLFLREQYIPGFFVVLVFATIAYSVIKVNRILE